MSKTAPRYAFTRTDDGVLTAYRGGYAEVRIPDDVVEIAEGVFRDRKSIRRLVLPESLETIGAGAFAGCIHLEKIEVEKSCALEDVGENAFAGTPWLLSQGESPTLNGVLLERPMLDQGELVLSETIRVIPKGLFRGWEALSSLRLPEGLEKIGAGAFADCVHLEEISGECLLQDVGKDAFAGTPWLRRQGDYPMLNGVLVDRPSWLSGEVVLPKGIRVVPEETFRGCAALTAVHLPEGLEIVWDRAFQDCTALEKIHLPQSLRDVGEGIVQGCSALQEISFPDGLQSSGSGTFENCTSLTRAVFAQGFSSTGEREFRNCTALEEAVVPEEIDVLEAEVFQGCTKLKRVVLPSSLRRIEKSAFEGCTALQEIALPEGIQEIGEYAFYQCNSLREIRIPADTALGVGAFMGSGLEKAVLHDISYVPASCFKNCVSLKQVEVRGDLEMVGEGAFYQCHQLQAIALPNVRHILDSAFEGCTSLHEIVLPASLKWMEEKAFAHCSGLQHVSLEMGSLFNAEAFLGCPQVSIEVPASNRELKQVQGGLILSRDRGTLLWCNRDVEGTVRIPDRVRIIRKYAFANCTHITEVVLPKELHRIEKAAFAGCSSLKTVVLPKTLAFLEEEAFRDTAITELTIPDKVQDVEEKILQGCPIQRVTVLCSVSAFQGALIDPEPPGFALIKAEWPPEVPIGSRISWVRGYFGQLQRGETISFLMDSVFRTYIQHNCAELWADPVCLHGMLQYQLLPAEKVQTALDAAAARGDAGEAAALLEYQRTIQNGKTGKDTGK